MWETDSHRDEYCFVPTNSKVWAELWEHRGAVQRGGSGAWADLQGAFELSLQEEQELGRQRRVRVSLAAESAGAKARGGTVQRPLRRPVPWCCDMAELGGGEMSGKSNHRTERNARLRVVWC